MKRLTGPLLAVILLAGIGVTGYRSHVQNAALQAAQLEAAKVQTVRGLIGSEKEGFFSDPRLATILQKNGLRVQVEKAGSRAIAQRGDVMRFDFAHPSGARRRR